MSIEFSNVPLAPIATIMAALITALISFVNLTLSKEQKTSEFRQAWIDGLRVDLAAFFSSARALCRVMQEARSPDNEDEDVARFRFTADQVGKMRFEGADALYRIKLRLNKAESRHNELNGLLDKVIQTQNKINQEKGSDYTLALQAIDSANSCSQDILKAEWERVKGGEKQFKHARNIVIPVIAAISFMLFLVVLVNPTQADEAPESTIENVIEVNANR
ncbi:hypothetical protein [Agarivorans sp. Alg241-V36]|uniref:hypothetical protein n=1 Tax=Agarivorans sp. Alg241-V36 TaxID=2305992 RepID=UPI0013D8CA76|nr:hypothetical protein [Agarivorans sp. Alg241-V36]